MHSLVVQPSFQEVIQDAARGGGANSSESFWILREAQDTSVEYRITPSGKSFAARVEGGSDAPGNTQFAQISKNRFELTLEDGTRCRLQAPTSRFVQPATPHAITAIAVHALHIAVGDSNGAIHVINKVTNKVTLSIPEAHFSDVTALKIFPSGKVLISGSLDMRVKIWSLENGSNPRTLVGHTSSITAVELLGQTGRNLLTASQDGTVRLWETSSAKTLHTFRRIVKLDDPVTALATFKDSESTTKEEDKESGNRPLEFETSGVFVYVGYASGNIQEYDVREHAQTEVKYPSIGPGIAVTALFTTKIGEKRVLVAGYSNGAIKVWGAGDAEGGQFAAASGPVSSIVSVSTAKEGEPAKLVANAAGNAIELELAASGRISLGQYLVGTEQVKDLATDGKLTVCGGREALVGYKV